MTNMFDFQKNGTYPLHLHSKGQKATDTVRLNKKTHACNSTLQNYIYSHT